MRRLSDFTKGLVSTEWLFDHLDDPSIAVVDASWYLPDMNRDPKAEFAQGHIPGAQFIDLDEISDQTSSLPHTMPSATYFASEMSRRGLGSEHSIVCYDGAGLFSAARFWWMCRAMGHETVAVLDGGLPKWSAENRSLTREIVSRPIANFVANPVGQMCIDTDDVLAHMAKPGAQIADARGNPRFAAHEPEPRAGVRGGHIPGSRNVPYKAVLTETGEMRDPVGIRCAFEQQDLDPEKPIVTTCGSGVTAAILRLALHQLNAPDGGLYDGSWSEWGSRHELPIEP